MSLLLLMDSFPDHTRDDQIKAWGPIQSVTKKGASEKPPFHFRLRSLYFFAGKSRFIVFSEGGFVIKLTPK
jgi:hypothetical protein